MFDTIIVAAIILIAAVFVGRKLLKPLYSKEAGCNCSGCGQSSACSGIQDRPDQPNCCGPR